MGLFDKCMTLPLEEQLLTIGRIQVVQECRWKKKTQKNPTGCILSLSQEWKSQVFTHHIKIMGDTLKNHLHLTLIQNYSSYQNCCYVLLYKALLTKLTDDYISHIWL